VPKRVSTAGHAVAPTGPALLELVRVQGERMLAALRADQQERYRIEKDRYIELLKIAEHDAYCVPILTTSVQAVLDEESRAWRARKP
jgi:hypothetical protein